MSHVYSGVKPLWHLLLSAHVHAHLFAPISPACWPLLTFTEIDGLDDVCPSRVTHRVVDVLRCMLEWVNVIDLEGYTTRDSS